MHIILELIHIIISLDGIDFLSAWGSKGRVDPSKKFFSWILQENDGDDNSDVDSEGDGEDEDKEDESSAEEYESDQDIPNHDVPTATITGGTMSYLSPCQYDHKVCSKISLYNCLSVARGRDITEIRTGDAVALKGLSKHNRSRRFIYVYGIRRATRGHGKKVKEEDGHIM